MRARLGVDRLPAERGRLTPDGAYRGNYARERRRGAYIPADMNWRSSRRAVSDLYPEGHDLTE
jgi:hypothetical protein